MGSGGLWDDIGISRPAGRRLPSEGEPSAGGEALKEERKKEENRETRGGRVGDVSLSGPSSGAPAAAEGGWAAAV